MGFLDAIGTRLRHALAALHGPAPQTAAPQAAATAEASEFEDLLDAVGAEPETADDSALRLRDATIEGLQEQLANLRDLGDRLAQAEQARLAAESELERMRAAPSAETDADLRAENDKLKRKVEQGEARIERLQEKASALRAKVAERHRAAADRWHEIRRMRGERRELDRELTEARRYIEQHGGATKTSLAARPKQDRTEETKLSDLMQPDDDLG